MLRIHNRLFEYGFLAVLFCFAVSLFNLAGYIFVAMIVGMYVLFVRQIRLSITDCLLILFSVSYFLFYQKYFSVDINDVILYLIGPWSAYVLAKIYLQNSKLDQAFLIFLFVLAMGMFVHGVLNVVAYIRSEHFALYVYYRQSVDFWRGDLVNVKTTEMLYTFATGMGIGVIFSSYKMRFKIIAAVVVFLALGLTVFLANRSLLIIVALLLAWRLVCWFFSPRVSLNKKLIVISVLVVLLLIGIVLIALNVAGLGDAFYATKIVQRFVSSDELTRFDVWELFFGEFRFLEHPFGGKFLTKDTEHGYLHNMWLDVYNVVGIVPFLLLVALSVSFILKYIRFNRTMKVHKRDNERIVFQCLMIASLLNMMVEPIIEANPYYFLMIMMFMGAMEVRTKTILSKEEQQIGNTVASETP